MYVPTEIKGGASDLEVELWAVVSYLMWVVGPALGSFAEAGPALNH